MWSTLAAWLLILVGIPLRLALTGTSSVVIERVAEGIDSFGMPRVIVILLLGILGLLASTWKRLVHSLFIDLTGREWVVKSSVLLALSFLVIIWPIGQWIHDDRNVQATLLDALPWILAVLVCTKMVAAAWIARHLYDGRLLSDRTLVTGAAGWLVAVLALYGLLVWLWATPHVARYFLLLVAILEIPLVRLSARRNQCGTNPVESVDAADVTRLEYTNCADDAAVVLYTVLGGGHTWPGGGPLPERFVGTTSNSIDASSRMWAFFREHRLSRK